jgi:threonine dehydratase
MVQLDDILRARELIAHKLHRTPMFSSTTLGRQTGTELYLKAELFQKTGSFKPRGALTKLQQMTDEDKRRGVITWSSGNHAQGLAYSASTLGIPATVVMPEATHEHKVQATRGYGAEVILHGTMNDVVAKCQEVQQSRNLTMVDPFDDPLVIAGQGTLGLEVLEDVPQPDFVFIAVGGGGLISGVAAATKLQRPQVRVIGVEPTGAPTMYQSLRQGVPVHLEKVDTIAEGLSSPHVGQINLDAVQKYVDDVVLVSDHEIVEALQVILERCKLLAEPAGAASFAPLLFNRVRVPRGSRVVCVLGGGNVDVQRLKQLL